MVKIKRNLVRLAQRLYKNTDIVQIGNAKLASKTWLA